ncbi:MAG: DNA repair protein RadA [Treponema sp.]|nr:DNA repair protein RadA [Treponema sp.]MBQ2552050.1 DNA repair protein RadA [Treponema sp.]MBQ4235664.1 DNA repair protein RadA [Treponema sp.]MBQ5384527.1 DNA repair protein RadA [Treponema sp.]
MAKKKGSIVYKCSECSYTQPGWLGRCPECGSWNTLEECIVDPNAAGFQKKTDGTVTKVKPVPMSKITMQTEDRTSTGNQEFDRVLGGGATKRSAILVGGEPGIGKSTLLIQCAASVLEKNEKGRVLYVSGEESASQVKGRAIRLGLNVDRLEILCTLRLEDILDALTSLSPVMVIIDSIQTVYSVEAGMIPGTVNQLKYCANELISWVKERDSVLFMTCHVTKDGTIAGPKSLEHMVDTVLSFERSNDEVRFLRAQKNRFGSVDELGIFKMESDGLKCVSDPSALFITRRQGQTPAGVACVPVFEGSRVFVVEIQALTVPSKSSVNRVFSDKIDSARVSRVAAVLEKRGGIKFSDQDLYINVAGGVRLTESAIDAALAAALYSARTDLPLPEKTLVVGELSLAGEIRPVTKLKQRIKTGKDLSYARLIGPKFENTEESVESLKDLINALFAKSTHDK